MSSLGIASCILLFWLIYQCEVYQISPHNSEFKHYLEFYILYSFSFPTYIFLSEWPSELFDFFCYFRVSKKVFFTQRPGLQPPPILVAGPLVEELLFATFLTKILFLTVFSIVKDVLICLKKDISCNNSSSNILTFNLPFYKQEQLPI